MENFIKTSGVSSRLTGLEKTAILLAELGPLHNENYNSLLSALNLSTSQIRKIRITMQNLKPYLKGDVKDISEIYREQAVLQELLKYGELKGIAKVPDFSKDNNQSEKIRSIANQEPSELAKLLQNWMDE